MTGRRSSLLLLVSLSLISQLEVSESDILNPKLHQNYDHCHSSQVWEGVLSADSEFELHATKPECERKCGDVDIPYPFGLSRECAQNPYFVLECAQELGPNMTAEGKGPWPLMTYANGSYTVQTFNVTSGTSHVAKNYSVNAFQVERIDPGSLIINVTAIKAMGCDNEHGVASVSLERGSTYWISKTNQFFVVGCRSKGSYYSPINYVEGGEVVGSSSCGPISCVNLFINEICGLYDCCAQQIPYAQSIGLEGGGISFSGFENCGFCTVLDPSTYRRPPWEGGGPETLGSGTYGLLIEWFIPTTADSEFQYNCTSAAHTERNECSLNADCTARKSGYFCSCDLAGYDGDGYENGTGCKDSNECESGTHNCTDIAKCDNIPGSYQCNCPGGMTGNGLNKTLDINGTGCTWINKCENETLNDCSINAQCTFHKENGSYTCTCRGDTVGNGHDAPGITGCQPIDKSNLAVIIGATIASVTMFASLNAVGLWFMYRRRRRAHELALFSARELVDELQKHEGAKYCKLFTYSQLQEATNDFSVERKLGSGGFGSVFEGTLEDGTIVAIKRAEHALGETRNDAKQFVNEIIILSQVNHRNLVRLFGCCLETKVPVLVYEFVPNGDLQQHINFRREVGHESGVKICTHPPLNWNQRMKIAVETAEALNYLHWGTTPSIYHQDVKCANILLDDNCNVKVADFGLSKLVSLNSNVTEAGTIFIGGLNGTKVESRGAIGWHMLIEQARECIGTPGYMDPDVLDRWEYSDKSDVYSYGVVLLVLLTAQKPVDFSRLPQDHNLVLRCSRLMAEGLLILNLDPELHSFLEDSNIFEAINAVAQVAMKCVRRYTNERPSMKEMLAELQVIETKLKSRSTGTTPRKSHTLQFIGDRPVIRNVEEGQSISFTSVSHSSSVQSHRSEPATSNSQQSQYSSGQLELTQLGPSPR